MHDKENQKKYHEDNKERIREQRKEYRRLHAEEIKANKRRYNQLPDVKAKKKVQGSRGYLLRREDVLQRHATRRRERLEFIAGVALQYGCQNSGCKWENDFISSQLDFHHLDPTAKVLPVSKMESCSYDRIVTEINKCVVLCKNCHVLVHAGLATVNDSNLCSVSPKIEDK